MSIWQGVRGYYTLSGVRGLLAISSFRILGSPKEISVRPSGVKYPVKLRLRTSDISVYHDILVRGECDVQLPGFVPRTIVDAGANVGMASIYYANKFPAAKIIAVEPEPSNYAVLVRNVSPYSNVVTINAALWNRDGKISLAVGGEGTDAFSKWGFVTREGDGTKVRAMTMQTLMTETNLDFIDLLKMDVEGAEKEIFENCEWVAKVKVIAIELHERLKPGCSASVSAAIGDFQQWQRGELTFAFRDHR
jgi:FkbM family methyltransferase